MSYLFDSLHQKKLPDAQLDSAAGNAASKIEETGLDIASLNGEIQQMRKAALIIVLLLSDAITSGDLDEDELGSDRLEALLAGFASDDDDDGEEITADEATYDILVANVKDALATLGVSDDVIETMFGADGEDRESAIEVAAETVESNAPTGDDIDDLIDLFAYGEANDEDGEIFDGISVGKTTIKSGKLGKIVYKAVKAIRNGKVKIVNKRVAGKVKLNAKQRSALKKARRKATTGTAVRKRTRSARKHARMGI